MPNIPCPHCGRSISDQSKRCLYCAKPLAGDGGGDAEKRAQMLSAMYKAGVGLPVVYFHYRYKLTAWLTGVIESPHMRLPQLPPPVADILVLRDALLRAGKPVVRNVKDPLAVAAA